MELHGSMNITVMEETPQGSGEPETHTVDALSAGMMTLGLDDASNPAARHMDGAVSQAVHHNVRGQSNSNESVHPTEDGTLQRSSIRSLEAQSCIPFGSLDD